MPPPNKRNPGESNIAKRRKAQVLDAAAECFRHKGFHRTSMAEISAAAGMSSGHIYHYFKSKEDIISAIVERERNEIERWVEEAKISGEDADVVFFIDELARGVARQKTPSFVALAMEILAEAARNPEIAAIVQHNNAQLHESLYALFKDHSPKLRARLEIIGALMTGLSIRTLQNPTLDEDLDIDMLRDVIRHVLKA